MRRLFRLLVGSCVISTVAVTTTVMPVATADEATPPASTSSATPSEAASPSATDATTGAPTSDPTSDPTGGPTSASPDATRDPASQSPDGVQKPLAPLAGEITPSPAVPLVAPVTTLNSKPPAKSTSPNAKFSFTSSQAGVTFQCKLSGPGQTGTFAPCAVQPATGGTTGSTSYSGLKAGTYTFTVHATPSVPAGSAPGPDTAPYVWRVDDCTTVATLCPLFAPGNYWVPAGAKFNRPLSTRAGQLINLNHVIRTVNSMPGYRVADPQLCKHDPALIPSRIRISLYSVTNMAFARAMVDAHRRCVSVQILMNNHLSAETSPAIALMQKEMGGYIRTSVGGKTVDRRSFARRCSYGCRGSGVLHSKFYLFDSRVTIPGRARIAGVTMVGSSNMTGNASGKQWNDLFTVKNNAALFGGYSSMFDRMKVDKTDLRTVTFSTGPYATTFWPQTPGTADPTLSVLNKIRCKGATGGSGYGGRTILYINMHAWSGTRGHRLADRVRQMYANGCHVRILYSFMTKPIFTKLTSGTGSRMVARRTLFSLDGDKYADVYSHFKMIAASGVIGSDHSAWAVWTGSNNFSSAGIRFDEVMLRISQRSTFAAYRDHWNFIRKRKSSATWAAYSEPIGGGRPPAAATQETKALRETTTFAVQNRQVVLAPDATAGTSGDVEVLD
jgi:hypothetical protein